MTDRAGMRLNADFRARVVVHTSGLPWVASPVPGVERRMLDRIGDEVARATSLVRYAPGSQFTRHVHGGGEEFLVLDGVFQDEHGVYPVGSYVRNPPQSAHTPASAPGCTLLVKLWQFDPADRRSVVRHTADPGLTWDAAGPGARACLLHADARERVTLEDWAPNARITRDLPGGGEFLLLSGACREQDDLLGPRSWLRLPPGTPLRAEAGPEGCRVWCKTGHLREGASTGPA